MKSSPQLHAGTINGPGSEQHTARLTRIEGIAADRISLLSIIQPRATAVSCRCPAGVDQCRDGAVQIIHLRRPDQAGQGEPRHLLAETRRPGTIRHGRRGLEGLDQEIRKIEAKNRRHQVRCPPSDLTRLADPILSSCLRLEDGLLEDRPHEIQGLPILCSVGWQCKSDGKGGDLVEHDGIPPQRARTFSQVETGDC
jgi:hypothetical protein